MSCVTFFETDRIDPRISLEYDLYKIDLVLTCWFISLPEFLLPCLELRSTL